MTKWILSFLLLIGYDIHWGSAHFVHRWLPRISFYDFEVQMDRRCWTGLNHEHIH